MANYHAKPPPPGPGRPKGSENKTTVAAKQAIQEAFDLIGGVPALMRWARKNRTTFYKSVYPRILPHEITGAGGKPISVTLLPLDATA